VVCRRYRPGPAGEGDEERLFRAALGPGRVFAGTVKRRLARDAARAGAELVLVDDGFSHWRLARDLDVVLLDASDPWGGGRLLPAGRLREPVRALQRAHVVVLTRVPAGADVAAAISALAPSAPGARWAAGRHEPDGVRTLGGEPVATRGPAHVVTATGNPAAVAASAAEAGFGPVTLSSYRDHHWFSPHEAARERDRATAASAIVVLTAKDAVRWPAAEGEQSAVLHVRWRWLAGGDEVERWVIHGEAPWKRPMS
jgi:tetraacyldisaccharide 4'-kinase